MDDSRKILSLGIVLSSAITNSLCFTIPHVPGRSSSPSVFPKEILDRQKCTTFKANKKNPIFDEDDDDDDYEDDKFEYARLRRGRGRGRFSNDNAEVEESESARVSRETDGYGGSNRRSYDSEYDEINFDQRGKTYNDEEEYYDEEDEDYYDDDDEFDGIIPNPLLDQIDPDGAIERLPELFSDKKFWKDSAIWFFLAFLYLLNRYNNPMLNGVVDLDKVDFSQFYNTPNP